MFPADKRNANLDFLRKVNFKNAVVLPSEIDHNELLHSNVSIALTENIVEQKGY